MIDNLSSGLFLVCFVKFRSRNLSKLPSPHLCVDPKGIPKGTPPGTLTKDKLLCVDVRLNRVGACRKTYLTLHILTNLLVLFRVVDMVP